MKRARLLIASNYKYIKKKQNGLALLALVIVLALSLTAYYFSTLSLVKIKTDSLQQTRIALKQAKHALIAYASTEAYVDTGQLGEFGFLPCPDSNNGLQEGVQDGTCAGTNISKIGWLPNITIEQDFIKDGAGACLMYAVSGAYKQSPITGMLNEDTNGQFQIVDTAGNPTIGVLPQDRVVAIIFSAGDVLTGQSRTLLAGTNCGRDYTNVSGYLEGNSATDNAVLQTTAEQIDQFIHATAISSDGTPPYNDKFITITRDELWSKISTDQGFMDKMNTLTEALAKCLSNYATINSFDRLPFPAPMSLTDYRIDMNYDDNVDGSSGYAGRLPLVVTDSNTAITVGGVNDLFLQGACDSTGGIPQNLSVAGSEYQTLWKNWKDHFFYVVSQDYAPDSTAAGCSGNCVTVDGITRAAVVFFSGTRLGGQVRTGPVGPDANTKQFIRNYIENGNDGLFPDVSGNAAYNKVNPLSSNDIMYCLTDTSPTTVVNCTL